MKVKIELGLPRSSTDPLCGAIVSRVWDSVDASPFSHTSLPSHKEKILYFDLRIITHDSVSQKTKLAGWKISGKVKIATNYESDIKTIEFVSDTLEISNTNHGWRNVPVNARTINVVQRFTKELLLAGWNDEGNNFTSLTKKSSVESEP